MLISAEEFISVDPSTARAPTMPSLSTPVTISTLPLDVVEAIIQEVATADHEDHRASTLYSCALVHPSWTDLSLDLLYRELLINDTTRLKDLAAAVKLRMETGRQGTKSLRVEEYSRWPDEITLIMAHCQTLEALYIGPTNYNVPKDLCSFASFADLTHLSFLGSVGEYWIHPEPDVSISTRLQSLTTDLDESQLVLLGNLVHASLSNSPPSLTTLSLCHYDHGTLENVLELESLAPILRSLSLLDTPTNLEARGTVADGLLTFISLATSLSHFLVSTYIYDLDQYELIFDAIAHPLHTFELHLDYLSAESASFVFEAVLGAKASKNLSVFKCFASVHLGGAPPIAGVRGFLETMKSRGTKVISDF